MEGPDDEFRVEIGAAIEHIDSEDQLDEVLARIEGAIAADVELPDEDPERLIEAVAQWASVASYPVGRFYGPAAPGREMSRDGERMPLQD